MIVLPIKWRPDQETNSSRSKIQCSITSPSGADTHRRIYTNSSIVQSDGTSGVLKPTVQEIIRTFWAVQLRISKSVKYPILQRVRRLHWDEDEVVQDVYDAWGGVGSRRAVVVMVRLLFAWHALLLDFKRNFQTGSKKIKSTSQSSTV